jgi:DNA helicase-2/ATP-dependent DNA helicase PcrA
MEWPVVLVPWLCEGLFPSAKASEEGRLDEERRLFYVVVTRAKDSLYMFSPQVRKTADGGMFPVEKSPYIKEIPPHLTQARRVLAAPQAYAQSRPYGNYGGGYGSYGRKGPSYPSGPVTRTTWRR